MLHMPLILAVGDGLRTTFEWGRIQTETDWIAPLAVCAVVVLFACWMYRRDARELNPAVGVVLAALRVAALVGLLIIYLQPQWRNERDVVTNSRVLLLVDTSLSMGLHDSDASSVPAEPSRAQQVIAALGKGDFLDRLRKKHDVVVVRFDQDSSRVVSLERLPQTDSGQADAPASGGAASSSAASPGNSPQTASVPGTAADVDWDESLSPRGTETRLGQALRQLIYDERAAPISAIVVFTDGQQNAGIEAPSAIELASRAEIPIFPVGIGSVRRPVNVRVSDFIAPARAYPGDSYSVTGYIQAQGMVGETVTVELFSRIGTGAATADDRGGQLEATEPVTLGGDGEVTAVKFNLTPEEIGRRTLRLQVKPPAEDRNNTDDVQEVDIEVVDRKNRALLFAGGPSREYQFLRNQLHRDKDTLVDVLLQTGSVGVSQDANEILDDFPATREEMFQYDCVVAFDPDWRELDNFQIDLLEEWVAEQAGGLIVIAGPIFTDSWAQDENMGKIRALYPVQFYKRFSALDDAQYGSKEPWPIELTREGLEAEFLWLTDSGPASVHAWQNFEGVYGYFSARGAKDGATVYGRFSDPRAGGGDGLPVYMAGHFFGSGRVFYMGSAEMWRLRADDEAYFERLYTQLVRYVSQGRLLRGSNRGVLLVERDRYLLGNTVDVRAQLTNIQLEPLVAESVNLEVVLPDSTLQSVKLSADPTRQGSFRGQFPVRKEGVYRLELPLPESEDERLTRRIQVKVPDLERENPQRNDPLLSEIAEKTAGAYYVGLASALGLESGVKPLVELLKDKSRTTSQVVRPDRLWDNQWVLLAVCGVLCLEWLIRRLMRLA